MSKPVLPPEITEDQKALNTPSLALQQYIHAATADNTRRTYRSAIRQFHLWGGLLPCTPTVISEYLLAKANTLNPRTLQLHVTALCQWHLTQGFPDPTRDPAVKKAIKGILRSHGKPKEKATALHIDHIAKMLKLIGEQPSTHATRRDQALILVGFLGGFRRSELVGLQIDHLDWQTEGLVIQLPRSKTDQTGEGMTRALPCGPTGFCPVEALHAWITTGNINKGPVFRPVNRWDQIQSRALHPGAINDLLKKIGARCGFDFIPSLSSHSLRRGMATAAARAGADFKDIKSQGGWKSDSTVWEYIEEGRQFEDNAAKTLVSQFDAL